MTENSYRFFSNRECQYYPCHEGIEEMNCLFCYCPLYERRHCPGAAFSAASFAALSAASLAAASAAA